MSELICVIEDDAACAADLCTAVEDAGYQGMIFTNSIHFFSSQLPSKPVCFVVDFKLPDMTGFDFVRQLRRADVHSPFLLVTAFGSVPIAVEATKLGAVNVLEKPIQKKELAHWVQWAAGISAQEQRRKGLLTLFKERLNRLSFREKQVLHHMKQGFRSKVIAKELSISIKTIEVHRSNILKKLEVGEILDFYWLLANSEIELSEDELLRFKTGNALKSRDNSQCFFESPSENQD